MSDPAGASLEIFIIGAHLGESIVIRTPGGAVGIIDSYASDLYNASTNLTLNVLKRVGAGELRFVALTHPHMDHFRGLPAIFKEYQGHIREFWVPPFGQANFRAFIDMMLDECEAEESPTDRRESAHSLKIFRQFWELARAERKRFNMRYKTTQDHTILLEEPEFDFSISCLGPTSNIVLPYQEGIVKRDLKDMLEHKGRAAKSVHNVISSVLVVKYGGWRGILGGDTEQRSWNDLLDESPDCMSNASFIKVSHHGSPTGSFERVWDSINSETCNAVVTCFASQRLPKQEGIHFVAAKGYKLHTTNRPLAERLSRGLPPYKPMEVEIAPFKEIESEYGEVYVKVDSLGYTSVDYGGKGGLL